MYDYRSLRMFIATYFVMANKYVDRQIKQNRNNRTIHAFIEPLKRMIWAHVNLLMKLKPV